MVKFGYTLRNPAIRHDLRMKRPPETGFSLTELAIVLVVVGLLFAFTLPISSTLINNERRAATAKKLDNIQAAVIGFAMTNKRLPCPADGNQVMDSVGAGVEDVRDGAGHCASSQLNGVIPWKTIGLSSADALDAWYNQITYRVGYALTVNNSLDMSNCDPAGTGPATGAGLCATTCIGTFTAINCTSPTNFLAGKGLQVSDGAGIVMNPAAGTGAAYVLVSHGENGYGAYSSLGTYQATAAKGVAGTTMENPNINVPALVVTAGPSPIFFDAPQRDASDATVYFDDLLVRPPIMTLINKAQLGPRSH